MLSKLAKANQFLKIIGCSQTQPQQANPSFVPYLNRMFTTKKTKKGILSSSDSSASEGESESDVESKS